MKSIFGTLIACIMMMLFCTADFMFDEKMEKPMVIIPD